MVMIVSNIISMSSGFTDPYSDTMPIAIPASQVVFRHQTGFWVQITDESRIRWVIERPRVMLPLVTRAC
jgi:hypothetical protein